MAYPDPKVVTVAAPTNTVNATRPNQTGSARSTAPTRHYVVVLNGGRQAGRGQQRTIAVATTCEALIGRSPTVGRDEKHVTATAATVVYCSPPSATPPADLAEKLPAATWARPRVSARSAERTTVADAIRQHPPFAAYVTILAIMGLSWLMLLSNYLCSLVTLAGAADHSQSRKYPAATVDSLNGRAPTSGTAASAT